LEYLTRFERATFALARQRSSQLSYRYAVTTDGLEPTASALSWRRSPSELGGRGCAF
jgi:hypothetical protein